MLHWIFTFIFNVKCYRHQSSNTSYWTLSTQWLVCMKVVTFCHIFCNKIYFFWEKLCQCQVNCLVTRSHWTKQLISWFTMFFNLFNSLLVWIKDSFHLFVSFKCLVICKNKNADQISQIVYTAVSLLDFKCHHTHLTLEYINIYLDFYLTL